jgi:DNA-directed RNA polymerase specialized sigma24 family protein
VDPSNTTIVLTNLLDRIQQAHVDNRADDLQRLVGEFITAAAKRLEELAHRLICKYAPHMAGETDAVFSEAYKRLHDSLAVRLPPAKPADYFPMAAVQIRFALKDMIRDRVHRAQRFAGPVSSDVAGNSTSPPEKVGRAEMLERFFVVINNLPGPLRSYYDLHWIQGLSHPQCGQQLGLSLSQAKARWEEVRVTLGRRLGDFPRDL